MKQILQQQYKVMIIMTSKEQEKQGKEDRKMELKGKLARRMGNKAI